MTKLLLFILLILALGFGFSWLADTDGEVQVTIAGQLITVDLVTGAALLVAAIAAVMIIWWLIKAVLTSPQRVQRFFRSRRRDRGYQALSTGIIAAGAGDPNNARKMLKRAGGLLDSNTEPLIQLLDAQAIMLEGKHDEAREKFEAMLGDPELRDLGLRGLYMEAQRLGDRDAQKHYAEKAAELAPQLAWASKAALDLKTAAGDWDGAIRLLDRQKSQKQIDKDEGKRKRAVLLTALAGDNLEKEPAKSKSAAMEAHKLAPEFSPAAVAVADACARLNEQRRAAKVLETTWRKAPHPDVALAYVNVRPGDSAADRLKRAQKLEQLKPNTAESSLIVAQMALEAGEFDTARKSVAALLRNEPRESAFMLMADIEDAQTGDQGKVREWLSRAVRAARDPAWTADGYVSEKWAPFSPITGRIDAFEWKVPVEQIGGPTIENDLDPMVPGMIAAASADAGVEEAIVEPAPASAPVAADPEMVSDIDAATTAVAEPSDVSENEETKADDVAEVDANADDSVEPSSEDVIDAEIVDEEATDSSPVPDAVDETPVEETSEPGEAEEPIKAPIPDDPGVDPAAAEEEKNKRFRLF